MYLLPRTKFGKWAVGLATVAVLLLVSGMVVVQGFGQEGGETFLDNLWISVPMLGAGASIIVAFFAGVVSIWKQKERAILVFIVSLIGLIGLWFAVGELLVPH